MVELPPVPVVCSSTQPWMEKWRSRTCRKILRSKKITDAFKDEPKINEKIIESFKKNQRKSLASTYTVKLRKILGESRDKIVECSNEKVQIGKFMSKAEDVIARFEYDFFTNKSNIAKRLLRPIQEMVKILDLLHLFFLVLC